jgi:hypothetical protein
MINGESVLRQENLSTGVYFSRKLKYTVESLNFRRSQCREVTVMRRAREPPRRFVRLRKIHARQRSRKRENAPGLRPEASLI